MIASDKPKSTFMFKGHNRIYAYVPEPDITAWELAEVMRWVLVVMLAGPQGRNAVDGVYDTLPPEAQRHIAAQDVGSIVVPSTG